MSYRDCIARIAQAAGRKLSDDETRGIYERVHQAALDIKAGRGDVKTGDLFPDIVSQAAQKAAADLVAEAAQQKRQAEMQVVKMSARMGEVQRIKELGVDEHQLDALDRTHFRNYDGKADVQSYESRFTGILDMYSSKLLDTWHALGNDFLGFWQDKGKLKDLLREILGEDTGNALARQGAKKWSETVEAMRKHFNSEGGAIGKLDEGYLPQGWWDQERVARMGEQKFVDALLPALKKEAASGKHYNDGGIPWDEARLREFLSKAYDTISTGGHINTEPGKFQGAGKTANRHAEHRQIHFPDADSALAAWETFGGKTALEIMTGHVEVMARDIALLEHYGPNPQMTIRTLLADALKNDVVADRPNKQKLEARAARLEDYINYSIGKTEPIAHPRLSRFISTMIPINVASKLGGAVWASAFGDKPMMEAVAHLNNLPELRRWGNELSLFNPANAEGRRALQRQGLMLETARNGLLRFGDDLGNAPFANKLASAVMRITGMNAVNGLRKGSHGAMLMDAIGFELKRGVDFNGLHDTDRRILKSYGITAQDWAIWQKADLDDMGKGYTMLTPEAISRVEGVDPKARRDAIVKLLGAVNTEADFAIVTPGMKERAQFHSIGNKAGIGGEIGRAVLQFKSFPWAMFRRQMDAFNNMGGPVPKAAMASYLVISTTLAGAMIMQVRDMLSGKDPRDMTRPEFWGAAFLQGGALGIYGDFIYGAGHTRYGSGILEAASGPTVGPLLEMGLVQPIQAIAKAKEGKDTKLVAQTVQDAKGFVPGNNVWYTKAALDHLIWQQAMESLSPGYLSSIRSRAAKEYNQDWWWGLGERSPDRAPNLGAAIGD